MYAKCIPVIARFTESALRADALWVRIWICCDVRATVQSCIIYSIKWSPGHKRLSKLCGGAR